MKSFYFTFGQCHVHTIDGFTYDKDVVVKVEAFDSKEAREIMFDFFGKKWGFQYNELPEMKYFPRGIKPV